MESGKSSKVPKSGGREGQYSLLVCQAKQAFTKTKNLNEESKLEFSNQSYDKRSPPIYLQNTLAILERMKGK